MNNLIYNVYYIYIYVCYIYVVCYILYTLYICYIYIYIYKIKLFLTRRLKASIDIFLYTRNIFVFLITLFHNYSFIFLLPQFLKLFIFEVFFVKNKI